MSCGISNHKKRRSQFMGFALLFNSTYGNQMLLKKQLDDLGGFLLDNIHFLNLEYKRCQGTTNEWTNNV